MLQLPAQAASSSAARDLVATAAHQLVCMSDMEIEDLCVAVGEAFANIVRHGKAAHGGDHMVSLCIERKNDRLLVHLVYRSEPFNTAPLPPAPEDMAAGGYGLYIMRALADTVEFEFEDGTTHLCLEKRCNPLASQRLSETGAWPPPPNVLHHAPTP